MDQLFLRIVDNLKKLFSKKEEIMLQLRTDILEESADEILYNIERLNKIEKATILHANIDLFDNLLNANNYKSFSNGDVDQVLQFRRLFI